MASPPMCANNCGFYGSAATKNMCLKCFREVGLREAQENLAKLVIVDKELDSVKSSPAIPVPDSGTKKNRCLSCDKKIGLLGFKCRCGSMFCSMHRYPEKHECSFDFKAFGQKLLAQANPLVKADKIGTRLTDFV